MSFLILSQSDTDLAASGDWAAAASGQSKSRHVSRYFIVARSSQASWEDEMMMSGRSRPVGIGPRHPPDKRHKGENPGDAQNCIGENLDQMRRFQDAALGKRHRQ